MVFLVAIVSAIVVVETVFFAALAPLLPRYVDRFALSESAAGVVVAAYSLGAFAAVPPTAFVAGRIGLKATASLGLLCIAITTVAFGLVDSGWSLGVVRFGQGASSTLAWASGMAWLVAGSPRERRGELIGVAMGAAVGGAMLGPPLGALASALGTRPVFGVASILALGLAVLVWWVPEPRIDARLPLRGSLAAALANRRIVAGMWLVLLAAFLGSAVSVLGPLKLDLLGFGASGIAVIFVVAAGLGAAGAPLFGRWLDRQDGPLPVLAALTASAVAAVALALTDGRLTFAVSTIIATGIFVQFWVPGTAIFTSGMEASGLDPGVAFSIWTLAWPPGAIAGAAGVAALAGAAGERVAFLGLAAVCAATATAIRRPSRPALVD